MVTFERKSRVPLPVRRVRAALVGSEQKMVRRNRNYSVEGTPCHQEVLETIPQTRKTHFSAHWEILIPADVPTGSSHQWWLEVLLEGENGPVEDNVFVFAVEPASPSASAAG